MKQDLPEVVVRTALMYTRTTSLADALLVLLGADEIKRCEDDTCQKEFIFQEPFPLTKKPRDDAQFCSDICARRTSQRAYRRRTRKQARENRTT